MEGQISAEMAVSRWRLPFYSRDVGKFLAQSAIAFAGYYIAGKTGLAGVERSSNLGPVWPKLYGFALAAVLCWGYRVLPALVVSATLVAIQSPAPLAVAASPAMGMAVARAAGSYLLALVSFDRSLPRLKDALWLVVVGALGSPVITASLGVLALYGAGMQAYSGVGPAWLIYWLGDGTGVLLVTPLMLTASRLGTIWQRRRVAEFTALMLLLLMSCLVIFDDLAVIPVRLDFLAFAVLPFTMWAAIRFGTPVVTLTTLLIAAVATIATTHETGPFNQSTNTMFTNAVLLDIFYAVLSVTGLILAAVISERARAETERDELTRAQALAQARQEAENKATAMRDELAHLGRVGMLGALSGALAHEINQPLAAIRVNTEAALLMLRTDPPPLQDLRETLGDIRNDNRRAGDVLQHVRKLLKKGVASSGPVDINAVIRDVAGLMHGSALKRGIGIELRPGSGAKPVWGDSVQIQQVVLNLLMNACDAVQDNEKSSRHVQMRTSFSGDKAVVEVQDTGPRLPDGGLERIFEPFYTTKHDGMGLGLSICRSIVEAHHGTLEAAPNPEEGMTFRVAFPFVQADVPGADTAWRETGP